MRMIRRVFGVLGLVFLMVLTGCSNTAARRTASGLELDLQGSAQEGHVILRVVSLRAVSMLNPKWQSVRLMSSAGRPYEMGDVTAASTIFSGRYFATESLYFAKLPVGRYEVTGFGSTGPGPGLIPALLASDYAKASKLPSFVVEPARLANLGTLVFVPEVSKTEPAQLFLLNGPMGGRYAFDTLLAESKRRDVSLPVGGGWSEVATSDDENQLLSKVRPLVSHLYLRDANGSLAGGSHLGQLVRRTGTDAWEWGAIDTLSTIFSTTRTASGTVVAGGEYGSYFSKSGDGAWQTHKLSDDQGRIVYMEPWGATGALLVTTEGGGSRYWVHGSLTDPTSEPKEVAKVEGPPDLILSTSEELLVPGNIMGIMRKTEIRHIKKTDFSVVKREHAFWVREWQHVGGDEIMMTRMNGMSHYRSRSPDRGKTWNHENTATSFSNYWMDQSRGYSLDFKPGFSTVTNTLLKTVNGGVAWEPMGKPFVTPDFAGTIVFADSDEILVQVPGLLFSSRDEGKTWVRVFPRQP